MSFLLFTFTSSHIRHQAIRPDITHHTTYFFAELMPPLARSKFSSANTGDCDLPFFLPPAFAFATTLPFASIVISSLPC